MIYYAIMHIQFPSALSYNSSCYSLVALICSSRFSLCPAITCPKIIYPTTICPTILRPTDLCPTIVCSAVQQGNHLSRYSLSYGSMSYHHLSYYPLSYCSLSHHHLCYVHCPTIKISIMLFNSYALHVIISLIHHNNG